METLKKNFEVMRPTSKRAKAMVGEEAERQFGNRFGGSKVGSVWGKGIGVSIHGENLRSNRSRTSTRFAQDKTANSK